MSLRCIVLPIMTRGCVGVLLLRLRRECRGVIIHPDLSSDQPLDRVQVLPLFRIAE